LRILFASLPADGHFNPLTGTAVHLARLGHDVRWNAAPEYAPTVTRLGMRVRGGMPAVVVGLRWTTKSLRHLTDELTGRGHRVSAPTVAALLREENFSLRGNAKTISRSVTTLVSATAGPVQQSFTLSLAPTSGSVKRGGRRRRRRRPRGLRLNGHEPSRTTPRRAGERE